LSQLELSNEQDSDAPDAPDVSDAMDMVIPDQKKTNEDSKIVKKGTLRLYYSF
jgi:hypothetical protein